MYIHVESQDQHGIGVNAWWAFTSLLRPRVRRGLAPDVRNIGIHRSG